MAARPRGRRSALDRDLFFSREWSYRALVDRGFMARRRKPTQSKAARGRGRARAKDLERARSPVGRARAHPFEQALAAVSKLLTAIDRPAAVIGGVAVIAHGFARATADIDVAVVAGPD